MNKTNKTKKIKRSKTSSSLTILPHQLVAYEHLISNKAILLFHKMGSGKTISSLYASIKLDLPTVIIGPKSSKKSFMDDLNKLANVFKFNEKKFEFYTYQKITNLLQTNFDLLNNKLVIIDEAHHLTGNDWGLAVQKIIANSKNLRVVLCTATPMKNLADDVIELINFLRPAEDPIDRDLVFTNQKNHLMEFKPGGREYFSRMTQGYISYYRGASPYVYAKQIDMGSVPPGILFTPLVRCPMNEFQLEVYNHVIANSDDTLDRRSAAVANFVFPSYSLETKDIVGVFGREGLSSLRNMLKTNKEKLLSTVAKKFEITDDSSEIIIEYDKTKSLGGKIFSQPYLQFFSSKFDACLTNLLNLVNPLESNIKNKFR